MKWFVMAIAIVLTGAVAAWGMLLQDPPFSVPATRIVVAPHQQAQKTIGVGIHRVAPGFDAEKTRILLDHFGFDAVRDEVGEAGDNNVLPGEIGPAGRNDPLAAYYRRSGTVLTITGGGSRQYRHGMPIEPADRESYTRFATEVARRLAGSPTILEVWNEWNLPTPLREAGAPHTYEEILHQVVPPMRAASPGAVILTGSVGNDFRRAGGEIVSWEWTRALLEGEAWKLGDGFSVHIYANCMRGVQRTPWAMWQRLKALQTALASANGGRDVPLYITEVGWPERTGACGFSPEERVSFPAQFLFYIHAMPSVRGVWLYELQDRPGRRGDLETVFGLVTHDYLVKPDTCGVRETIRLLKQYSLGTLTIDGGLARADLRSASGSELRVLWAIDDQQPVRVSVPASMAARRLCSPETLTGSLLVGIRPVLLR